MAAALSAGFDEIKPPDITKSGVEERSLTAHWISKTQVVYHIPTTENDMPSGSIPLALQNIFYKLQIVRLV
ncbi:putative ubiquitinyl hydrolase 1 [Helianthus annuus]|nr:putative ubiquitinyl hydrolase 1 [Helianthus annuus]